MRFSLNLILLSAALGSPVLAGEATLFGGSVDGFMYKGNGEVTVSAGPATTVENVYGLYNIVSSAPLSGASVTMDGGTIEGDIYGAYSFKNSANSNTVTISDGTVGGDVQGGDGYGADANNNTVTISGGTVKGDIIGGNGKFNTNGNTVIISGGMIEGEKICGGDTWSGSAVGAADNTVTISGGTIKGDVCGADGNNLNNNVVNLVGEDAVLGNLTGHSLAVGGTVHAAKRYWGDSNNNTINVYGKGISVKGIADLQNLNFYLTPNMANGDTMLTLTGNDNCSLNGVNVGVKCSGSTLLTSGNKVKLIHNSGGGIVQTDKNTTYAVDVIQGVSASYTGTVAVSANKKDLVLTLDGGSDTPKVEGDTLKSMTETRTNVAAMVNSAADFMATTGMQQAKTAAKAAAAAGKYEAAPFVALGGSHLRYNTGSHVDADGFNGALGVAKTLSPSLTLGVAGEYACGDYKSYVGGVRGKGDSKLYGGAILADWQGKRGWHAEGAVRLGRTHTDYSAMNPLGYTNYSDKASYQSALIGGGKEFKVSPKSNNTVDVYARYMYGHTNGSNAKASSGESLHFSGVNSHRTLVGARYNYELTDNATLYAGAAWMHEFKGDARAVIGGFTSPSPSLKGNSGMVELGTTFAPFASDRVLLNLNLQGWTGVQRGISGGAGCTVKF